MKRNLLLPVIFVLINLGVLGCISKQDKNTKVAKSPEIENTLIYLAENLGRAKFNPIRTEWKFDYGFKDGALLNKFEYIRSLVTYPAFQAELKYPIYLSGPHTSDELELKSKYTFGHYNPKFVAQLRKTASVVMGKKDFISKTKPLLEEFDILDFLRKYKEIYIITQKYPDEFKKIKLDYLKGIQEKNLPEGAYRRMVPSLLDSEEYWNWSETSYHFWLRRDLDNTKDIWYGLVTDILTAYDE